MNAKQYLNQLRTIEAVIRARKGQLERLRKEQTFLPGIAYDMERVQTSVNPDPMKPSDRLLDLEREIAAKVEAAERVRGRIIDEIESLHGMKFEAIACQMGYSYVYVTHLHGEALQAFALMKEPG